METNCKGRINAELKGRIEDLTKLWKDYQEGIEDNPELGNIYEYGLSFDYVAPGTLHNRRGYFRYQLSWGGPSDEFRIYAEGKDYKWVIDRIEYVFMDWFDGSKRTLSGEKYQLIADIFNNLFVETESAQAVFNKAIEEL
jgi:hypothetical protein